ncbi:TetR/AcrR family transcriptional regulator [Parasphingorhabdus cellanae]|uniref:TetR/AcrR family transcriptional regulator n=1 Tax=Parasphingorhabdus cellanae TaxID=2806553 RepID=A0ABX7T5J7_9SPHN|nr:TetR/AcrR family transcriptional regulator [Parasphingorhabdus cellanae]QTD55787.1 TetR/AcrR family transcriptional regulator [Parasphingorhabdus cellanae]
MATEYSAHVESNDKQPRTARGLKTKRKLLDAAALEFGEKGFHEASITGITQRAGTALGSFYTYFDSKDELFSALVKDMSTRVKSHAAIAMTEWQDTLEREKLALEAFMNFAREHKEIYRIIDEAEFVDPDSYRAHYEATAKRIFERLQEGSEAGDLRGNLDEAHAWAIMGMNVFLGLRYGIWTEEKSTVEIAEIANEILATGIAAAKS